MISYVELNHVSAKNRYSRNVFSIDNRNININTVTYRGVLETDSPRDSLKLDFWRCLASSLSQNPNVSPCLGLEVQMSRLASVSIEKS